MRKQLVAALLPLGLGSAEEALSLCAAESLPVSATRIVYRGVQR